MNCQNKRCDRPCPPNPATEGYLPYCCAPCARDAGGTKKLGNDRRLLGVFHTHACEERVARKASGIADEPRPVVPVSLAERPPARYIPFPDPGDGGDLPFLRTKAHGRMTDTHRERIARRVASSAGVELVDVRPAWVAEPTLCVLSTGSGLLMAALDHLAAEYPFTGLVGADLPGSLPPEKRAEVVDYSLHAWPTLLIVWASLRDPDSFILELARRLHYQPPPNRLWTYHQGLGDATMWGTWCSAHRVHEPWAPRPLGEIDAAYRSW